MTRENKKRSGKYHSVCFIRCVELCIQKIYYITYYWIIQSKRLSKVKRRIVSVFWQSKLTKTLFLRAISEKTSQLSAQLNCC